MDTTTDEAAAFDAATEALKDGRRGGKTAAAREAKLAAGEAVTMPNGSKMKRMPARSPAGAMNREQRRKLAKVARSAAGRAMFAAAKKARARERKLAEEAAAPKASE